MISVPEMESSSDSSSNPDTSEARVQFPARRGPSGSVYTFPQHDGSKKGSSRRGHKVQFCEHDRQQEVKCRLFD